MRLWILKAFVQKIISFMPMKHRINYFFQKNITRGVQLNNDYMLDKLAHFKNHHYYFNKHSRHSIPETVVELGTGWYPIIPLCFYLTGSTGIISFDIAPLVKAKNIYQSINMLIDFEADGKLKEYLKKIQPGRLNELKSIAEKKQLSKAQILEKLGIQLQVKNAESTGLRSKSIDLIISNNTFEHVYPHSINKLCTEFQRILKPDGIMSHFIDMSDHFAHLDQSITVFNFLQFSNQQWKRIDNSIQPQNRLRINHFRDLFKENQFKILEEENRVGNKMELESVKLNNQFKKVEKNDLLITHTHMILKKGMMIERQIRKKRL